MNNLYEKDYVLWSKEQASLLRQKRFDDVNWEQLVTELQGLTTEDENELQSRLTILIAKLLEWQYMPDLRCHSWRCMISFQRIHIDHLLDDNPGLKVLVEQVLPLAYKRAIYEASLMTGNWFDLFWAHLWPFETIMDEDFWPERWEGEMKLIEEDSQ